jgi:hypothetical protein
VVIHSLAALLAIHNRAWVTAHIPAALVVIHILAVLVVIHLVAIHNQAVAHILAVLGVIHNLAKLEADHSRVVIQNLVRASEVNSYLVVIVDYILIDRMVMHILKVVLQILAARNLVKHAIHQTKDTQDYN